MSLIEESAIDPVDLPVAVGWRILIEPIQIDDTTEGGIALPTSVIEAKEYLRYVGRVVAMGPLCYRHAKFVGGVDWCAVGDWVAYGQYAGQTINIRNKDGGLTELKLLNDDEVMCKLPNPESVLIYA